MTNQGHDIVPTALAIQAMRDNGYRDTAYAIAELIDNAIQANATRIELLCCEREDFKGQRTRRNIHQIAVLDNGNGMPADVLTAALQFGNGTYLNDRSGIGRFGMGLPTSSISQCRRVDVWTWQQDSSRAIHSYLDLNEVEDGTQTTVPNPTDSDIPKLWANAAQLLGKSGTLVVWSQLDRCLWKTAQAIIRNSEYIIGRMYRKFLETNKVRIRMASFLERSPFSCTQDQEAIANDPLYLMAPSSTPSPYNNNAMFEQHGDHWEVTSTIEHLGNQHEVTTRFTLAKGEARNRPQAGATPYGKHAKNNIGVSLVRADRELELETSLVIQYDPRERWWGVEIDFPPTLDEIFGVTNNKQEARNFTAIAGSLGALLAETESITSLKTELAEDDDPRAPLIDTAHLIFRRLRDVRNIIKIQTSGTLRQSRHQEFNSEVRATEITRDRREQGYRGASDDDEEALPPARRVSDLAQELEETGLARAQAQQLAARIINGGIKYTFAHAELEGSNFFTVKAVSGEIVIKLNIKHPAYESLVEVLEDDFDNAPSHEQLLERLSNANHGLKLLLMAWARLEDESPHDEERRRIQDIRFEWGKVAALFLQNDR